jgi:hypothetical protein
MHRDNIPVVATNVPLFVLVRTLEGLHLLFHIILSLLLAIVDTRQLF